MWLIMKAGSTNDVKENILRSVSICKFIKVTIRNGTFFKFLCVAINILHKKTMLLKFHNMSQISFD